MRKKLCLLLSLLLLAAMLGACGGEPEESTIAPVATQAPESPAAQEPAGEDPAGEEPDAADGGPAEAERQLSLGSFSGSTYTNSYAGFGCTLDGSWTFADAQQLQQLTEASAGLVSEADVENYFSTTNTTSLTDMYAESSEMMATVNVLYSKVSVAERLAYSTLDEEGVIDATLAQSEQLKSIYESMGVSVTSTEKVLVNFLGEEHYAMKTVTDTGGVAGYMLQFIDPFRGSYSITTTIVCYGQDNTQAVADMFFPVEG